MNISPENLLKHKEACGIIASYVYPQPIQPGTVLIYALFDPLDHTPKYIGKTSKPLIIRLRQHVHNIDSNGQKNLWIYGLKKKRLKPIIIELERVSSTDSKINETKWIEFYSSKGLYLFNIQLV